MANRSPEFRYIFSDAFGIAFSDNDCRVSFGINEKAGSGNDLDMYEQVTVAMTHKTTKLLVHHLSGILNHFEEKSGTNIPLDEAKVETLKAMLNASTPL